MADTITIDQARQMRTIVSDAIDDKTILPGVPERNLLQLRQSLLRGDRRQRRARRQSRAAHRARPGQRLLSGQCRPLLPLRRARDLSRADAVRLRRGQPDRRAAAVRPRQAGRHPRDPRHHGSEQPGMGRDPPQCDGADPRYRAQQDALRAPRRRHEWPERPAELAR